MDDDHAYNITSNPWGNLQEFYPKIIAPTVALSPELTELHTYLVNQKPNSDIDAAYRVMNKKEMEAKMRELENWNFRLYLDEGKEMHRGQQLKVLSTDFPVPSSDANVASANASPNVARRSTANKRPRRV